VPRAYEFHSPIYVYNDVIHSALKFGFVIHFLEPSVTVERDFVPISYTKFKIIRKCQETKLLYESVKRKMFQISSFAAVNQNAHFVSVFRLWLIKG